MVLWITLRLQVRTTKKTYITSQPSLEAHLKLLSVSNFLMFGCIEKGPILISLRLPKKRLRNLKFSCSIFPAVLFKL
jgi:hypothetical protein